MTYVPSPSLRDYSFWSTTDQSERERVSADYTATCSDHTASVADAGLVKSWLNQFTWRNTCHDATLFTINPILNGLVSNPGLRGDMSPNNRMIHETASRPTIWDQSKP